VALFRRCATARGFKRWLDGSIIPGNDLLPIAINIRALEVIWPILTQT
jgi:hypothetical protein